MVRWESERVRVRREIAEAEWLRVDDQATEDAMALGQRSDPGDGGGVEAGVDELGQPAVGADDAERSVLRVDEVGGRLDDAPQYHR